MFDIEFTPEAVDDLRLLRKYDQATIVAAVEAQLEHQPDQETMKVIDVPSESTDVNALLDQAQAEDLIVRAPDGREFMLVAVDEFDREITLTRRNERLMELLDARARQTETVPLDEVKRQLGLDE